MEKDEYGSLRGIVIVQEGHKIIILTYFSFNISFLYIYCLDFLLQGTN